MTKVKKEDPKIIFFWSNMYGSENTESFAGPDQICEKIPKHKLSLNWASY